HTGHFTEPCGKSARGIAMARGRQSCLLMVSLVLPLAWSCSGKDRSGASTDGARDWTSDIHRNDGGARIDTSGASPDANGTGIDASGAGGEASGAGIDASDVGDDSSDVAGADAGSDGVDLCSTVTCTATDSCHSA